MTTEEKFKAAVNVIRSLPKNGSYQPSNDLMLKFYAYFKQASEGPCTGSRPPFWELVGRAKYDAWKKLGDMPRTTAMEKYVDELHSIVETMSYSDNVANFLEASSNELNSLNINDLELIVGDVIERVRSQPNSPLASREGSPSRLMSSLSSSPSVSPTLPAEESDISDDEYIDTIENPEPRKIAPSHLDNLSNGYVQHVSRSRTKSQNNIDISQEVSKTVQSLRSDIERLTNKINSIEVTHKKVSEKMKRTGIFGGLSPQLLVLLIIWPFVATFVTNRYLLRKK